LSPLFLKEDKMAGKQPDWKFTDRRKASIKKARKKHEILVQLGKEAYEKKYGRK